MKPFMLQVVREMLFDLHAGPTGKNQRVAELNNHSFAAIERAIIEQSPVAFATALCVGFSRVLDDECFVVDKGMTQSVRMMLVALVVAHPPDKD
jgi:hypothetical protein